MHAHREIRGKRFAIDSAAAGGGDGGDVELLVAAVVVVVVVVVVSGARGERETTGFYRSREQNELRIASTVCQSVLQPFQAKLSSGLTRMELSFYLCSRSWREKAKLPTLSMLSQRLLSPSLLLLLLYCFG